MLKMLKVIDFRDEIWKSSFGASLDSAQLLIVELTTIINLHATGSSKSYSVTMFDNRWKSKSKSSGNQI